MIRRTHKKFLFMLGFFVASIASFFVGQRYSKDGSSLFVDVVNADIPVVVTSGGGDGGGGACGVGCSGGAACSGSGACGSDSSGYGGGS